MHFDKKQLRQAFKAKRQALTDQQQADAETLLAQRLSTLLKLNPNSLVGCYLGNKGEISLNTFMHQCWQNEIITAVPILHPFSQGRLLFQQYTPTTEMHFNHFGISEPILDCTMVCPLHQLSVIILPLVAFDSHRTRLGMGGGFYDRTLANFVGLKSRPKLVGVAHDCQYSAEALPRKPWDIVPDAIVTPSLTYK